MRRLPPRPATPVLRLRRPEVSLRHLPMTDYLAAQASPAAALTADAGSQAQAGRIVGRNMLALVLSQFVTTPVSIVVNAMLARALGARDFGVIYLASTVLGVGFLVVDWGGRGQVAAEIARDRK